MKTPIRFLAVTLLLLLSCAAHPYSLLTHEQLIDLTWKNSIRPLLLSRYPGLTEAQLLEAHAYAYGGCAIQDLGYYPAGDMFFSDLTHYVRPGDFVASLFRNAHSANEVAFAIGALSHYVGDTIGHPRATNPAVALQFPKLATKYGPSVNYAENPHAHVQVEFAFDIDQIAHHRFAPSAYLKHIGLAVPTRVSSPLPMPKPTAWVPTTAPNATVSPSAAIASPCVVCSHESPTPRPSFIAAPCPMRPLARTSTSLNRNSPRPTLKMAGSRTARKPASAPTPSPA